MIKFKENILEQILEKGTNDAITEKERERIKNNSEVSTITIEKICELLKCQPCDVIEHHKN